MKKAMSMKMILVLIIMLVLIILFLSFLNTFKKTTTSALDKTICKDSLSALAKLNVDKAKLIRDAKCDSDIIKIDNQQELDKVYEDWKFQLFSTKPYFNKDEELCIQTAEVTLNNQVNTFNKGNYYLNYYYKQGNNIETSHEIFEKGSDAQTTWVHELALETSSNCKKLES